MPILGLAPSSKPCTRPHFDIERVIRPNILALPPIPLRADDYQDGILLDANENALGHGISPSALPASAEYLAAQSLNRYPDPAHPQIKARVAALRGLPGPDHVFLGVGSDEAVDLLMRVCVRPGGEEKIVVTPPTYGMYGVCAQVNDLGVVSVPLELGGERGEGGERGRFSARVDEIKKAIDADPHIKLVFLCSPGNPTGTLISLSAVRELLEYEPYKGIVVVDEAYIDFADADASAATLITQYANLCVLQTLSKAFGLAAIRLGIALAQPALMQIMANTKAPYNIGTPAAALALAALSPESLGAMRANVAELVRMRGVLVEALAAPEMRARGVGRVVGGNDANFVMVPILAREGGEPDNARAQRLYKALAEDEKVVVRFRGNEPGCLACLRITVGSEEEVKTVLERMRAVLDRL